MPCRLLFLSSLTAAFSLLLGACAGVFPPSQQAYETVRPRTPPVRNITNFSESLRCMDRLFADYGWGDRGAGAAYVTSQGVIDKTGKGIGGDNREVLISTISKIAAVSGAFKFINYDPRNLEEISNIQTVFGSVKLANYEIIGAITQFDENVTSSSAGVTLGIDDAEISFSTDRVVTVLSVDFNASEAISRQVLNGINATNSIAIARNEKAGDAGGRIKKAGLFFNLSLDKNEGIYAALRALIELSTIEILGKIAKVPYWRCLQIEQTNSEVVALVEEWYDAMKSEERIEFVQRTLAQRGYYTGAVTGRLDPVIQDAITRYQHANDLIPSGRIDLALYRQLIGQNLGEQPVQASLPGREPTTGAVSASTATPASAGPILTLTTPHGPTPVYRPREHLSLLAELSRDGYLYCYYRDGQNQIVRIYPNRFQRSARITAARPVSIPNSNDFAIELGAPNELETVVCLASTDNLDGRIPARLSRDLEPLPVQTLEEIVTEFRQVQPDGLEQTRLDIRVGN